MRTSRDQPRKGDPGDESRRRRSGPVSSTGRTIAQGLRGISAKLGLADLAALTADQAEAKARAQARAEGRSEAQIRTAGRHARAAAHKRTAQLAGVTPTTARRWATGRQNPSKDHEKAARPKLQRAAGGAKGIQAAQVAGATRVDVGTVRVKIYGKSIETRNIGSQPLSAATTQAAADLILAGDHEQASKLLGDAILDAYGDGLTDFMEITDLPGGITWS